MTRPEEALHRAVAEYLKFALRDDEALWFHVPSGGKRTKAEAGIFKAMGAKAGLPDFIFIRQRRNGGQVVITVELKSPFGKLSKNQKSMNDVLRGIGVTQYICYRLEEIEKVLLNSGFVIHAKLRDKAGAP